jgi:predicted permease
VIGLARLLLRLAVPAGWRRECIRGDLDELYARHRERDGRFRATIWYWGEAVHAATRYLLSRFGRRSRRSSAPGRHGRPGTRRAGALEILRHDVAHALRTLRKAPGFTLVAALTIALGIGATTTIFSVGNAVLLRAPAGVRDHARLVTAHRVAQDGSSFHAFSWPNYVDYRDGDNGLAGLAAFRTQALSLSLAGEPQMGLGFLVSHNYFDVLGTRPALGRFFVAGEGEITEPTSVAVLGYRLWSRRFDGDSSVIGQTITVNRSPFTIIGVAEEGFSGHATLLNVDVYLPLNALQALGASQDLSLRNQVSLELVGRLRDGVTVHQAQQAMDLTARGLAEAHPEANRGEGIDIRPYTPMLAPVAGPTLAFMGLLLAVAGVILLIASINVGGMLLSRASTRGKEMALRLALGAPRRRLIRQLLTESVVLFLVGGGLGVGLTLYTTRLLSTFQLPIPLPVLLDFSPDLRALGFSLAVALVTGIVFGLAPALHVTKPDLNTTLKEDATTPTRSRLRSTFVIAQVAGSALLLVGAGLFLRALARADAIELGMDPDNVHVTMLDLSIHNYTDQESYRFYEDLVSQVASLTSVQAVGMIDLPPLSLGNQTTAFNVERPDPVPDGGRFATDLARVTPDYFETLRIPLIQGRTFTPADRAGAPEVVIINETVARQAWPGEDPVGKHMNFGSGTGGIEMEVVGVVRTGKYRTVGEEDRLMVYRPYAQDPQRAMAVMVRLEGNTTSFARTMRNLIASLDPALPADFNTSYREIMGIALLPNQAVAGLATLFGVLGLLLACVGLYGVLAFSVAQRTREIGIRMALGAGSSQVRAMILGHGARLAGIGLAIGFAVAAGVTRLLQGLLFGVSPTDPIAFVGIGALLMCVALAAAAVPAVRATRTNAVDALREY